jgi:peptidyl-prolyl cis-trans isomerase D
MLDTIRKRKGNFIVTFIILLIVLVMGVYGIGELAESANPSEVAWVNGEPISAKDYQSRMSMMLDRYRSMFGDQMDERLMQNALIRKQALDSLVDSRLLAQNAKKLGFQVSDNELADFIHKQPYFQKNGKFDYESYSKIPNRGLEERRMREDLRLGRYMDYLQARVQLTPAELVRSFELQETKVDLEFFRINLASMSAKLEATDSEVKAFLADTNNQAAIQAHYDSRTSEFSTPAEVDLRQIRVAVPFQASADVKAKAREKIESIAKTVTAQNFAEVAKAKSDDEFARNGGSRGWVARGTLEKSLEDALNNLEPKKVSAPIETSFGYYLLMVEGNRPAAKQPLESVKPAIAKALITTKKRQEFESTKKADWEKKLAQGVSIEPELKLLKIESKKTGAFSLSQGYIPQIGEVASIIEAVGGLTLKDRTAKKLFYHQDHYYYIKLASLERPKASDFAKHRESIARSLDASYQNVVITDWLGKLKKDSSIQLSKKVAPATPAEG